MQRAAAVQQASAGGAAVGSMTWARQVLAILAPAPQGFVKRCSCVLCGAPKKLPADAAERLLDRAGLANEYMPVQPHDGQPRHCGGRFLALSATAVICDGCGRTMDLASAEIPCSSCGATMTLPSGPEGVACPFCQMRVERAGIR